MSVDQFKNNGFIVTPSLFSDAACDEICLAVTQIRKAGVGARCLLEFNWCQELARRIREHLLIKDFLPANDVPVQCTYFEKSKDQNWLVPVHQDLSIPVEARVDHEDLIGWSEKEGSIFVQPPESLLQKITAVRLHIDECGLEDGPLKVVLGSHKAGRFTNDKAVSERDRAGETICTVERGGALLMKPLLLHASSKASGGSQRRVLHFVFGPKTLPYGLRWRYAV